MKYPLKKNKGPTKVDKMCVYCGKMYPNVFSASLNCNKEGGCHKAGLRTIYGKNENGTVRIVNG